MCGIKLTQVDDIKRANGLFGTSFGLKTELRIPKRSGVSAVNEVHRVVRNASATFTQTTFLKLAPKPIG